MLSYNAAKTKMLVGQWRLNLVGLETKLQNELDEGPQISSLEKAGNRSGGRKLNGRFNLQFGAKIAVFARTSGGKLL